MKKLYVILILLLIIPPTVSCELPQTIFISGVDYGVCVVPNINLWNKPGGLHAGARITTTVNGCIGIPAKVMETKHIKSRLWYRVKTFGINAGKSGWVTDSFIRH